MSIRSTTRWSACITRHSRWIAAGSTRKVCRRPIGYSISFAPEPTSVPYSGVTTRRVGSSPSEWLSTPSTCVQFKPGAAEYSLDPVAPGYRSLTLHRDGRIESLVHRATDYDQRVDLDGEAY